MFKMKRIYYLLTLLFFVHFAYAQKKDVQITNIYMVPDLAENAQRKYLRATQTNDKEQLKKHIYIVGFTIDNVTQVDKIYIQLGTEKNKSDILEEQIPLKKYEKDLYYVYKNKHIPLKEKDMEIRVALSRDEIKQLKYATLFTSSREKRYTDKQYLDIQKKTKN